MQAHRHAWMLLCKCPVHISWQQMQPPVANMACWCLQVAVDIVHHKTMNELHQKVAPSQVIVGW